MSGRIEGWMRHDEAFWRAHHEAWKRSDLNQREYCEWQHIPLKAFGNWRVIFKAEPQPIQRKLLWRGGGLSHTLSHSPSHTPDGQLSHVAYPSLPLNVPPLRDGHRRRFSNADRQRILKAARTVGVNEVVALPFTSQALMARIRSVLDRPRPFVDCPTYVGPCRRRVMLQHYKGPMRRAADPAKAPEVGPLWTRENNRSAIRLCVQKMSEHRAALAPEHYDKLRETYLSVMKLETRAEQEHDDTLGEAARSFGCYISAIKRDEAPDGKLFNDHIDAIHTLVLGARVEDHQRLALVASLRAAVEVKLAAA